MSKRTYESGSSKRKKTTAKADELRAVIEKRKPITQFFSVPEGSTTEVATEPEYWSRLRRILRIGVARGGQRDHAPPNF